MRIPIRDKKRFALIGYPLGHSISPFIHGELSKLTGTVCSYRLIEIEKEKFGEFVKNELKSLDGFNVTIPYKTEIIPFLDELSPRAEIFGSVNTVSVKDGKMTGYNTDSIGFARTLGGAGIDLKGDVLVLGCGGVSRMFAFDSLIAGANVTFGIRKESFEKAKKLSKEIEDKLKCGVQIKTLNEINSSYDLILNGTPVGMFPNTEECPLGEDVIKKSSAVFDAIYNPLETKLLRTARENHIKNENGLPMLVWQAAAAEEIWNDTEYSAEDISEVIKLSEEYLKK